MNKIRTFFFILSIVFIALLSANVVQAADAAQKEEDENKCTAEQQKAIIDAAKKSFKTNAAQLNNLIKEFQKGDKDKNGNLINGIDQMKDIDGCEDIVNDESCDEEYLSTDGAIEDLLDGYTENEGEDYEIDLEDWNDIDWTDHNYTCIENKANAAGNTACAEMAKKLEEKRQKIIEKISVMEKEAVLIPSDNTVSCYGCDGTEGDNATRCTAVDGSGNATAGASKGCQPLPAKYAEIKSCILCPLFQVILDTDQTMATKSYDALASSFRNVIVVVLALFIAYQTLITVSAFTKQDTAKYITTLLTQAFKVFVAALLLSNSSYIYHYVINPLMTAGLEFGLALLFDPGLLQEFETQTAAAKSAMPSGVIGQDLLASVMAAIRLFSKAAAQMPAIGSSLICISMNEASNILPDFSMLIEGVLVFAFGWAIALSCCFYLLDSVVRFGIFCALLPFLIACWPFKVTASYTKTGWDIFMNAFFNFVMMGMVISLNSELISQALTGGKGGMEALENAINGSNVDTLKDLMDISGTDFLVLVACCMFAFKLVGQINELANQVSGTSGGTGIGNKIGGAAAQAVKKTAGTAAKIGAHATGLDKKWDNAQRKLGLKPPKSGSGGAQRPGGSGGGSEGGSTNNENKGGDSNGGGSGNNGGGNGGSGGGDKGGGGGGDSNGGGSGNGSGDGGNK